MRVWWGHLYSSGGGITINYPQFPSSILLSALLLLQSRTCLEKRQECTYVRTEKNFSLKIIYIYRIVKEVSLFVCLFVCLSVCLCRVWRPNCWMDLNQIWHGALPLDPGDVIQKNFWGWTPLFQGEVEQWKVLRQQREIHKIFWLSFYCRFDL